MKGSFLSRIPPLRLLCYLMVLGILPVACALCFNIKASDRLEAIGTAIAHVQHQVCMWQRKQSINRDVRRFYQDADRYYLDKYLESISSCQREVSEISRLIEDDPSLPDRDLLQRLEFLKGNENRFRFAEGALESYAQIRETTEKLVHPVEVSQLDLPLLLSRLEGPPMGEERSHWVGPQILITDFSMQRKSARGANEVFVIDLQFIKREFL